MSDLEERLEDGEIMNNEGDAGQSSMDGPGKFVKKVLGIKTSKSQTYSATFIPSSANTVHPQQSTITDFQPSSSSMATNISEQSGDHEHSTVFTDTGTAIIQRGDEASIGQVKTTLSVPPYVISPDENSSKPGLALLIINDKFARGQGGFRAGAKCDLNNMFEIFHNLNFEIRWEQFNSRTTDDLLSELESCAQDPILKQKKCLAIVISSHGAEVKLGRPYRPHHIPDNINVFGHAINTFDGMLPTNQIMDVFDDYNCPYMEGKPRLLFIQACRARNNIKKVDKGVEIQVSTLPSNQPGISSSSMDVRHQEETPGTETTVIYKRLTMNDMLITPCYENYMVAFASTEAHIAWSEDDGGVMLTNMYRVFKDKIKKEQDIDLLTTMSEVSNKMTIEWESNFIDLRYHQSKSVMSLLHMLEQEIILKPSKIE